MGQSGTMSIEVLQPGSSITNYSIVDTSMVYSWDKMEGETSDDYARFEYYRRQGPSRSIRQAYIAYLIDTVGEMEVKARQMASPYALTGYPTNWGTMAKRNHWQERAAAFDAHQHELDMQVETAERDRCRQLRKTALHDLLTASTNALAQIDLSEANLAQASTAIKTAVRELRIEYHDDASTQVEINAMLAIIPNELRQGILAMLQARVTTTGMVTDNIIDDNDNNDNNDNNNAY